MPVPIKPMGSGGLATALGLAADGVSTLHHVDWDSGDKRGMIHPARCSISLRSWNTVWQPLTLLTAHPADVSGTIALLGLLSIYMSSSELLVLVSLRNMRGLARCLAAGARCGVPHW